MAEPDVKRQFATLCTVTTAFFTDGFVYGVVVPAAPHAPAKLTHPWMFGLLFGAYAIGVAVTTPFLGHLANRVGRRRPLLWGSMLQLLAIIILTDAHSFAALLVARLAQGAAAAVTWTAGLALVADYFVKNRPKVMGVVMLGGTCGLVLGPLAGGVLLALRDYAAPFHVALIFSLVDLALRFLLAKDLHVGRREHTPLAYLWEDKTARPAVLVVVLGAWVWSMLEALLPGYLEHTTAASPAAVGLVFTLSSLVYGLCCPLVGTLAYKFGARRVMPFGVVAMGLSMPLLTLPRTVGGAGVMLGIFGVAYGFAMNPTLSELAAAVDRHGSRAYASSYAVYNLAYSAGTMLSNLMTGILTSFFPFSLVMQATGIMLLACLWAAFSDVGGVRFTQVAKDSEL